MWHPPNFSALSFHNTLPGPANEGALFQGVLVKLGVRFAEGPDPAGDVTTTNRTISLKGTSWRVFTLTYNWFSSTGSCRIHP